MKRVEVRLVLMLDVEGDETIQEAFVRHLGDVGAEHVAEGLEPTGYEEN